MIPNFPPFRLVVLQDNEHFFPPYQGAPLLRQDTVQEYPQIVPVLDQLSGKITDSEMRNMNYEVDVEGMSPATVAKNFLTQSGLLP
ncbi:hypothetical protein AAC03nite_17220 [Alicyclobacillus acidoterrestris]|nr:hypothetical protein AAC03nite_17220 [Alicyclobacillus acidoterrestris]